jgi:putative membrane-bound dehydrogenase-like protein
MTSSEPRSVVVAALLALLATSADMPVRPADAQSSAPDKPAPAVPAPLPITVPPGFTVEKIAGTPLTDHPMMACFDDRGRLYIAEAAGQNLKSDELLKNPVNSIRLLEDTDGDGRFDKSTVFADKMVFPQGVLWLDGSVYTCSPPSLWKLTDTDGDGVADTRVEVVSKFGFTGNAADIHGPFPGPDGRLYWCDGRHGHNIRQPDGSTTQGKAARIFRCRPDGRDLEVICGGGMDNPTELTFTAEGEPLATVNILIAQPARIDAIIDCIEGGVWPYHDVLREFKKTGDLLGPAANLGWVAVSGIARCRSGAFGAEYRDNLFTAQFNRRRIQRHVVERDGATFRIRNEDFLVSSDPDFHPTDVLEDADGSLIVVDTGGWFRIGCPTSQTAKPQIKGGIYRVRKVEAAPAGGPRRSGAADGVREDPRGLAINWGAMTAEQLVRRLDDPRPVVADRAIAETAKRGNPAIEPILAAFQSRASPGTLRNAVWALARMETPQARAAVRSAVTDPFFTTKIAAVHSIGLHRDAAATPELIKLLAAPEPAVRRHTATALGRLKAREAIGPLFGALKLGGDRFLEHAYIFALIRIADREATAKFLADADPVVRRAALLALDQMDGGNLTRELVTPLLATDDRNLLRTALEVVSTRPGWAKELNGLLVDWLKQPTLDADRADGLRGVITAFCADPGVQDLVAQALRRADTGPAMRLLILETLARVPMDRLPAVWAAELRWNLEHADERVVRQAVACVRAARVTDFDHALAAIARDPARSDELRIAALATAGPRLTAVEPAMLAAALRHLNKDAAPLVKIAAAEAIGGCKLDDARLNELAAAVGAAGALEIGHLIAPFERSRNAAVGKKLVAALEKAPGLAALSPEAVRRAIAGFPAEVKKSAEPILKKISVDTEAMKARLAELSPALSGGDAARGREVFTGKKASCNTCHAVNGEGGRVGPDLTKIGAIRQPGDLLESVVFPGASIARGFETYAVRTGDGVVHTGLIVRDTAEAIYLRTPERAEIRLGRGEIEALQQSRTSIMPQGLDGQLSRQELCDLIAYLGSLK